MPATETPTAPTKEVSLNSLGSSRPKSTMPSSLLEKARAVAGDTTPIESDEPPKPSDKPKEIPKETTDIPATPIDPPKREDPKPATVTKKTGIDELREAHERASARVKELEQSDSAKAKTLSEAQAREAELSKKLAEREEEIGKTFKPAMERLTAAEKRIQEQEEKLRITNYTATNEWHERYEKPLVQLTSEIDALAKELEINVDGVNRVATRNDLDAVLSAPTLTRASQIAKDMFGDSPVVGMLLNQRSRLRAGVQAKQEAYKNAALESENFMKQKQLSEAEAREKTRRLLLERTEQMVSAFRPQKEQAEEYAAYEQGLQLADLAITGGDKMTPDEFITIVAKARTSIIRDSLSSKQLEKANARIQELETQLKEYQGSEPEVRTRNGGSQPKSDKTPHDRLMQAALKVATKI